MSVGMAVELFMVVAAFVLGIAAIVRTRRQGGSVPDLLGLRWGPSAPRDVLAGLLITGLAMGGIFLAELGLGVIATGPAAPSSPSGLVLLALNKLAHTVKEELIWRSLLMSGLLMVLRGRVGLVLVLSALIFGLIHGSNPGASALSVLGNALGGIIYGGAFILARSLWLPIGLHFAWNFVQGPVLGFPVSGMDAGGLQQIHDLGPAWLSGGSYGPEAGAIGIAARFVVMALVLLWLGAHARRGAPQAAAATAAP